MIINFNPYPEIYRFYKSFFTSISDDDRLWFSNNNLKTRFYSRGTWALIDGIKKSLQSMPNNSDTVWFPNYFCNDVITELKNHGFKIRFYTILKNMEPDWQEMQNRINLGFNPDVLVLVHYFGFPSNIDKAASFCYHNKIKLIEDCAHVLKPTNNIARSDIVIYSPRKLLPIPEIGLLISNNKLPDDSVIESKYDFSFNFIWFFRRFIQKLLALLNINWHRFKRNVNNSSNPFINKTTSYLNIRLLKSYVNDIELCCNNRISNYRALSNSIQEIEYIEPLFKKLPENVTPYVLPLIVKKHFSYIKDKLNHSGIPTSSWPDLPIEIKSSYTENRHAIYLDKHLLLFPIHQSLNSNDIDYIAKTLKNIIEKIK